MYTYTSANTGGRHNTMGYATMNKATRNECDNEVLSIKSGC
jgi:hypothetical protein